MTNSDKNTPAGTPVSRQSAKAVLEETIKRKEREVDALRVLMFYIDWGNLTKRDEELLWGYFVRGR